MVRRGRRSAPRSARRSARSGRGKHARQQEPAGRGESPEGLEWLDYASHTFNSIELNGTFYSLKSPAVYRRWADEAPDEVFVFAIKGGRFITHNLKLRNVDTALANFYASGVLALGRKTGPFLWQLPARGHDERLRRGALVASSGRVRYRHVFEDRHPTYFTEEFYALLRERRCALVIADTAGRYPYAEEVAADFVYVRLHGSRELYVSDYTDAELDEWADRVARWRAAGRDVYVYFDNDAKVHAPFDALRLRRRVDRR